MSLVKTPPAVVFVAPMQEPSTATHRVEIATLGERLSALRLCDAEAITTMRRSLAQYGQLVPLTLLTERGALEIIDGFKRVRAARALGWTTVVARPRYLRRCCASAAEESPLDIYNLR